MRHLLPIALALPLLAQPVVDYDIVYVRAPRFGDNQYARLPEVFDPIRIEPGADLMLLHPNGTEEVLFAGGNGSVVDPTLSFDAKWVYFSYFPDLRASVVNYQRRNAPPGGPTKWSANPLRATSADSYYLGYGIFNLGPCPIPGGRVMFVSSRDSYVPNKDYTFPNLRLYVMDEDGKNVEPVGHLNIGSALHPTVLKDGRVMFSSSESQGLRDQRIWGLWAIWPDGRKWEPLFSAFANASAMHFQSQLSDGRVALTEYYNLNNNGYGTVLAFPANRTAPFGSPNASDASNPLVRRGIWWFDASHPAHKQPRYKQYPFSPPGLVALSGFTHGEDEASSRALDGSWSGKVTHPSGAPDNDLLLSYSPGPANSLNRPTTLPWYDGGIYLLDAGVALTDHTRLILIRNSPNYNEIQPRAVVPYSRIYGVSEPAALPWLPNDGSGGAELPAGTPFGLVGTSSFYNRNTSPGAGVARFGGLDPFNSTQNEPSSNWFTQGADAGRYSDSDIWAVRIIAMEGVAARSYGPRFYEPGFRGHAATERLRILGEIPLRKPGVTDPQGNPDTSFLARIPADTPFSFQTLDKDGMVLNMAQTWHQVRPGETRADCGGCHAHARMAVEFSQTAAGRGGYAVHQLIDKTPLLTKDSSGNTAVREVARRLVDVEFYRDVKPILQRSCVPCHTKNAAAPGGLVLDDTALVEGFEGTWHRLANDENARYGIKPVIASRTWRQFNVSRYVRAFQSRRSLLAWKILGRRTDGWTNADHPTESTAGNAATLPSGANANDADLDFTGTIMPPPASGIPPLTEDEKLTIIRWIDLGCPVSSPDPALSGWFADELKPTLTVSSPRAGANASLSMIRIGMYDSYSGLDRASFSVKANFPVNGKAAGTELAPDFTESPGQYIWTLALAQPVTSLANATLTVRVKDAQNNWSAVNRTFSVGAGGDTQPPAVSITAPAAGAAVSGSVRMTAVASDNSMVAGVRFRVDGVEVGPEDLGAPYEISWNSLAIANGTHRISARARDAAGNTATSSDVTIEVRNTIADTAAPTVSITAPAAGAVLAGMVTLSANAADAVGVAGVQFLVDNTAVGAEDTAAPFAISWNSASLPSGAHTITARARDAAGNVRLSSAVRVLIHNFEGLVFSRSFDAGTAAAGRYCRGQVFTGTASGLSFAHTPELALTAGMTISAWIRPDALAGPSPILVKERTGGVSYALYAAAAASRPPAGVINNGTSDQTAAATAVLPVAAWSHLAVTFDGARLILYLNGAAIRTLAVSGNIIAGEGPLRIGGGSFAGVIDEVRLYSRALSDLEIRGDINRAVSAGCPAPLDTQPPAIAISEPANNTTVADTVRVSAAASDVYGVREVQYLVDGRAVSADRAAPYAVVLNTSGWTAGAHQIVAVAIDAAGNRSETPPITVIK